MEVTVGMQLALLRVLENSWIFAHDNVLLWLDGQTRIFVFFFTSEGDDPFCDRTTYKGMPVKR